jgi:rhodanese-related sulfurtransferase
MQATLSVRDAWERARRGAAILIDLRFPAAFCRGHPAGAISVIYSGRGFGERVALAAPGDLPVIVLTSDPGQADGAVRQLAAVGRAYDGTATDDPAAWRDAGLTWETLREVPLPELGDKTTAVHRVVLDVREPLEWETGYVPGAQLIALGRLREEFDRLPRDREIVAICEAGVRSATAASILRAVGFPRVAHVPDGTAGYRRTGRPLAFPEEYVERE